ncbi:endonuclease/exonuclease/phosphatase family protein [Roseateles sp. BYS180W]|uniref:Endonuclease/exonuclease/phosphatase family protein n=1 Tax=Roseateles rivi TaxID=3299028 RepID=A0ABW7FXF4_9BURK
MNKRYPSIGLSLGLLSLLAQAQVSGVKIGTLQGSSHRSPFENQQVSAIQGIVTALDNNGFWIQDSGDGDLRTSDAIYVFLGTAAKPLLGDALSVSGRVVEFRRTNNANNLSLTEINATAGASGSWQRISSGNALPSAIALGSPGWNIPSAIAPRVGNVETAPGYTLQPSQYAMDFYESLEGMRVSMGSAVAVAATGNISSGDTVVVSRNQLDSGLMSSRGAAVIAPGQFNGHRLTLDNRMVAGPNVNVGARIDDIVGVIDYTESNYRLFMTQTPVTVNNPLTREVAAPRAPGALGIASYNVENLGGNASATRFTAITEQIKTNLALPQILSLQEVQDNNGATNDGTVSADTTLSRLTQEIKTQTGKDYGYLTINPNNNQDGGQPGGNIRQAFLYDRSTVSFDAGKQVGGSNDAISASLGQDGQLEFHCGTQSFACVAGRVAPDNGAWTDSRKPLVVDMNVQGQQLIIISNHFNSKGGDQPLFGPDQAPVNGSETQRLAQAQVLAGFVHELLTLNPDANIIVTGDFNDFQFADTLKPLLDAGLVNLSDSLSPQERYSYIYQGNAQQLDHMFVSRHLQGASMFDIVHANSEFADQVSDHDPLLLTLNLAAVPEPQIAVLMGIGLVLLRLRARRG